MIRIGVLGAGHLGKIHLRLLKEVSAFQLVGFFDPDPQKAAEAEEAPVAEAEEEAEGAEASEEDEAEKEA